MYCTTAPQKITHTRTWYLKIESIYFVISVTSLDLDLNIKLPIGMCESKNGSVLKKGDPVLYFNGRLLAVFKRLQP